MTDVNPFFAALTDENKSYFKSSTTVISKLSSIVPFSMYCNGVPFPTEHDPVAGVISFKCLLIGEFVEITDLDAPESKYIHSSGLHCFPIALIFANLVSISSFILGLERKSRSILNAGLRLGFKKVKLISASLSHRTSVLSVSSSMFLAIWTALECWVRRFLLASVKIS